MPLKSIDERFFDSPYYITPNDEVGQDAFAVIREAMKSKGMVGLGRVVISKRERPIILRPLGKGLEGITLRYPYEVRSETEYFSEIPDVKVPADMLKLAEHIVESKADEFTPSEFIDHYEVAVVEMLKQKQAGKAVSRKPPRAAVARGGNVIDLLKRSLQMESKRGKTKAPPLQPAIRGKTKTRARA